MNAMDTGIYDKLTKLLYCTERISAGILQNVFAKAEYKNNTAYYFGSNEHTKCT